MCALVLGVGLHTDTCLGPEVDVLVCAIAERFVVRFAAAAEGEPIAGRDLEFVPVVVDEPRRAVDAVGPVPPDEDGDFLLLWHSEASVARTLEEAGDP
jgi:hypothetical protein